MNLLEETIEKLLDHDLSPADVEWVGIKQGYFDWDTFSRLADREYDSGFGGQEVNPTLKVVGKDWWLERHEYDGSEWWEFKRKPKRPKNKIVPLIGALVGDEWYYDPNEDPVIFVYKSESS